MIEFALGLATVAVALTVTLTVGLASFEDWFFDGGSGIKVIAITLFGIVAVPATTALILLLV